MKYEITLYFLDQKAFHVEADNDISALEAAMAENTDYREIYDVRYKKINDYTGFSEDE